MKHLRSFASTLALGAALGIFCASCEGRPRSGGTENARSTPALDAPAVIELDLTRGAPELGPSSLFGAPRGRSFADLIQAIEAANDRSTTKGFFVRIGTANVGLARGHEIGRALAAIRKAKKPVVCHADDLGNGTLLLASLGCDRIWLSPAGNVSSVGLAAELIFGHRLLEKLHVEVNFLQVGKYKGAQEPFTRDSASPEAKESVEGAMRGLRKSWLEAIAEGRGKPGIADLVEDGPYAPEDAVAKGLVDEIGYADDAREDAKKLASAERVNVRFGSGPAAEPVSRGLVDVLRALAGPGTGGEPHVAIVPAIGAISMGGPTNPLSGSDGITERELGRTIARLSSDESTKAVVLRIDSPGGSALASDLLWKRLMKLRTDKPLVISVGGMAASGGYYLACSGTKIVAEPTSIVGSIGVVSGKLSVGKALSEIGVTTETIAAAPDPQKAARATYMSMFSGWDEPTRQKVLDGMQSVYDLFVRRISEGRGQPVEKIAASAEGRIFGGVEAKDRGLVDDLGGLSDAIKLARDLAHLPDDTPAFVVGEGAGFLDFLGTDGDDTEGRAARAEEVAKTARQTAVEVLLPEASATVPEVGRFFGSLSPLLAGERTLVAMPFGLVLR